MNNVVRDATILGIDYSEAMLKQAYKMNIDAIATGKVRLLVCDVSNITSMDASFDKVLSVNPVMFWVNPLETLQSFRTLMRPNGKIVLAAQVRERGPAKMNSEQVGLSAVEYLTAVGYSDVCMYKRDLGMVPPTCIVGVNR